MHNDFSIRGIKGNGTSSYLNGIPGLMTQFAAPTFMIGDIQFISGPNSGITGIPSTYETTAAGGIVNFVSKATEAPLTRYRQTFSGKGSFGEYLDVSRRFGKDKEWGVRINTELLNGNTAINSNDMEAQVFLPTSTTVIKKQHQFTCWLPAFKYRRRRTLVLIKSSRDRQRDHQSAKRS